MGPPSRLVVVARVPEADDLVARGRQPDGLGAHVTLVAPMAGRDPDAVRAAIAAALRDVPIARARFARVERFATGVLYLAPDDALVFDDLARRLREALGVDDPRPFVAHVTLARPRDGVVDEEVAREVREAGPVLSRIAAVGLYRREGSGPWREVASVPLAD